MQPFDLEKALAGAKLVTREGNEVRGFKLSPIERQSVCFPYEGYIKNHYNGMGGFEDWDARGAYLQISVKHRLDLFLAD